MDYSVKCAADYHQGSNVFSPQSRGKQCVPNCLVFLIYVKLKHVSQWLKPDLHCVMHCGDQLYHAVRKSVMHDYLLPNELPKCIIYKDSRFHCKVVKTQSGTLKKQLFCTEQPLVSLEQAFLSKVDMTNSSQLILIVQGNAIGIYYDICTKTFFIFDSHARDGEGLCSESGTCVVGVVETLCGLCAFIRTLVKSYCSDQYEFIQFDLHSIVITSVKLKTCKNTKCDTVPLNHMVNDNSRKRIQFLDSYEPKKKRRKKQAVESTLLADCSSAKGSVSENQNEVSACTISIIDNAVDVSSKPSNQGNGSRQKQTDSDRICNMFHMKVNCGPEYVCTCCNQIFFKHTVHQVSNSTFKYKDILNKCLTDYRSVDNIEWICVTCSKYIKIGKIPPCSIVNGLAFPAKPPELELTQLEERLVSPRLTFMQLREMPRGGQLSVKGNIVNVPADVNSTTKILPRMLSDSETIYVKFKRKLSYKHHVAFERVRPNKVIEAAKWLVSNSELFRNQGISVDDTRFNEIHPIPEEDNTEDEQDNYCENTNQETQIQEQGNDHDLSAEDDAFEQRPTGNLDTVLQSLDFREFNQTLSLAPGEGNTPLGLFQDEHSEYLAFPSIYCGQVRPSNSERIAPIHYSTICKSELRSVDRRVAMCVPNIFFKLKKLQIKQIRDKVSLAIRKCKLEGRKITVGELLLPGGIEKILKQDEGYRILRTLRGSPPYWEQAKKDIFAMIRQLGMPTWFCSFSAAETKWQPLLRTLYKLIYRRDPTDKEIEELNWFEKCHLIKSDPVTCTRYFDHRVQAFMLFVLKDPTNPIGEINDFVHRVEFQQRGSPHIHMLIWIKNAPVYGKHSNSEVTGFIDRYVCCQQDQSMPQLINFQTHRHARTCRKRGKSNCRFGFPLPPLPCTTILEPLGENSEKKEAKQNYLKVMEELNVLRQDNEEMTFDRFLHKLEISYDTYILALRSSLKVPKVFLKRSFQEVRINNYNTILLKCWEANLDIQYVLDPYACVSYIVSYMSKGQRGMSNLLSQACYEAKALNNDIKQQVRRIGNQFLNHVEVGAQEAAYLVLQMPLRKSSRQVLFVDTQPPEKRTVLLKSVNKLEEMKKDATNIESDNTLKRYIRRPKKLENCCYADFASWYSLVPKEKKNSEPPCKDGELPEDDYSVDEQDDLPACNDVEIEAGEEIEFRDGTVMKKCTRQKIIRFVRYSENEDKENYFREQVMLFSAWRNEVNGLLKGFATYEESYASQKGSIELKRQEYEKINRGILDEAAENSDAVDESILDNVVPEMQHQESIDAAEGVSNSKLYGCFDPGEGLDSHSQYDIGQDIGIHRKVPDSSLPGHEICDDEYRTLVQKLNEKQKEYFYHVLHWFKTKDEPLYSFLTGGAGVGKSVVLRALYQALLKYFNHQCGENPDEMKILLCAPTGKAAHNIGGSTVHSSFCIPVGRGFRYKPLDMQQLNTLRSRFINLKVVFIDEISMVGKNMFNFINLRLQEIRGSTELFGGVSIICVGDLFQLKPIYDAWIFSQSSNREDDIQSIATNLWADNFSVFELEEVMRQKDDQEFANLLNRLREGNQTDLDVSKLQARVQDMSRNSISVDYDNLPHLYTTRAEVTSHNDLIFAKLPGTEKVIINSVDCVSGDISSTLKEKILSKIPDDESVTMGLHKTLRLGLNIPSELCVNVNVEDGLTNGTPCIVKQFDYRVENSDRCSIVWVVLEEPTAGIQWRQKYRHLYTEGIDKSWTPILELTRNFNIQYFKTYSITRRQFPIHMAAAKTIHKSQGSTMQSAVIHFGTRKHEHMHYVGLSRVKNLSSLHILNLSESKIAVSNAVIAEIERLRTDSPTKLCLPQLSEINPKPQLSICFHNCRSLQKHIDDVKSEYHLRVFDIIAFCETRIHSASPTYEMQGYFLKCSDNKPQAHGLSVYTKFDSNFLYKFFDGVEIMTSKVFGTLNLCFVYCPPKLATLNRYVSAFEDFSDIISFADPTILMGDFNQDILKGSSLETYLQNAYNFKQLIHVPTTDYGSQLDHIYVNIDALTVLCSGTLESYFSDHKPLYLLLNVENTEHAERV